MFLTTILWVWRPGSLGRQVKGISLKTRLINGNNSIEELIIEVIQEIHLVLWAFTTPLRSLKNIILSYFFPADDKIK